MEPKNIHDDLIELSITGLMSCLIESNIKDQFVKELSSPSYEKIIRYMRDESTVIQMRDFHNWIKLVLITNIANYFYSHSNQKVSLLDIAVGRGGDLSKWKKAQISYVFGFDPSDKSINSIDKEDQGAK